MSVPRPGSRWSPRCCGHALPPRRNGPRRGRRRRGGWRPIVLTDVKNEILSMRGYTPSLEAGALRGEVSEAVRRAIERTVVLREGGAGGSRSRGALEEEVMRFRADFPPGGSRRRSSRRGWNPTHGGSSSGVPSCTVGRRTPSRRSGPRDPQEVEEAFLKERNPSTVPERIRVRQYLFDSAERAAAAREKLQAGGPSARMTETLPSRGRPRFLPPRRAPPELPAGVFDLPEGASASRFRGGRDESVPGHAAEAARRRRWTAKRRESGRRSSLPGGRRRSAGGWRRRPRGQGKGPHGSAATTDRGKTMTRTVRSSRRRGGAAASAGAAFPRVIDGVVRW